MAESRMTVLSCMFGSTVIRVASDHAWYAQAVVEILKRQRGLPTGPIAGLAPVEIVVRDAERPHRETTPRPDGFAVHTVQTGRQIVTEALTAAVNSSHVTIEVAPGFSPYEVRVHLTVALNKALLYVGVVRLHAAAVEFAGRVDVFIGGRGAGKTSVSLALASAGGTILGEDGVIVRNREGRFTVSGADGTLRVLPDTEAHFFRTPLDITPQLFGGLQKKEMRVADRFAALPHVDRPLERLFFVRVGHDLRMQPLSQRATVVRLLETIRDDHRFGEGQDSSDILHYLSNLARAVPAFDLELSPRLADLSAFVEQVADPRVSPVFARS
jgi:hypothetical protein